MTHAKPVLNNLIVSKIYQNLAIEEATIVQGEAVCLNNPQTRIQLIEKWASEGACAEVIAQRLKVSYATVTRDAKKHDIKIGKKRIIAARVKALTSYLKAQKHITTTCREIGDKIDVNHTNVKGDLNSIEKKGLVKVIVHNKKTEIIWIGK